MHTVTNRRPLLRLLPKAVAMCLWLLKKIHESLPDKTVAANPGTVFVGEVVRHREAGDQRFRIVFRVCPWFSSEHDPLADPTVVAKHGVSCRRPIEHVALRIRVHVGCMGATCVPRQVGPPRNKIPAYFTEAIRFPFTLSSRPVWGGCRAGTPLALP